MSIPENNVPSYLSSLQIQDFYFYPDDLSNEKLIDYELGGVALNDTSEGLQYQAWTLRWLTGTGDFTLEAPNTPATVVHNAPLVSECSLAFDQNMNPFIAYVEDGTAKYWWFDTAQQDTVVSTLPSGTLTPKCCIDDKRDRRDATSDIILAYVHNGALKFRQERDRYTVEYTVDDPFLHPQFNLPAVLIRVGMNKKNRLQWLCDLANPIDWCGYVNYGN